MKKQGMLPFAAVAGVTVLAMLALNALTPLLADDYRYAFRFDTDTRLTSVGQIFPSLAAHAQVMNGRLAPHFFVQLFTLLPGAVFDVLNALVYLALLLGLYRMVGPPEAAWDWKLLLMVAGAVFLLPPAFGQSFLWLAGSVNYLWCDALMAWVLVPFAQAVLTGKEPGSALKWGLLPVAGLLLGNMSENVSAAAALMMGLCALWLWIRKRRVPLWMALTLGFTLAGWLALMLSPANRANIAQSGPALGQLYIRLGAALEMWMEKGLWPSLAWVALFCFARGGKEADANRLFLAAALFLCSLLCNFAMVASSYYPQRAYTGSVLLLILALGMALYALPASRWRQALVHTLALGLTLVMALQMAYALPSAYNRFRLAQAREGQAVAARQEGRLELTTYGIKGQTRFDPFFQLNELTEDPQYFPNVYFAKYYGLDSVLVDRYE
ncbi:MAG: DUF6056 family protein [Candidatus Limiplasma sp.]|nr:DUF6056 family protein [Candidatus Limiplasma sp.]